MSKAIFREHFEQIWNNKDASGIERFIAPNYRGFDAEELISGIEGYKQHFATITTAFPDTAAHDRGPPGGGRPRRGAVGRGGDPHRQPSAISRPRASACA